MGNYFTIKNAKHCVESNENLSTSSPIYQKFVEKMKTGSKGSNNYADNYINNVKPLTNIALSVKLFKGLRTMITDSSTLRDTITKTYGQDIYELLDDIIDVHEAKEKNYILQNIKENIF